MSSLTRTIQRGAGNYIGFLTTANAARGAKLGVRNEQAKDLKARLAREKKRRGSA